MGQTSEGAKKAWATRRAKANGTLVTVKCPLLPATKAKYFPVPVAPIVIVPKLKSAPLTKGQMAAAKAWKTRHENVKYKKKADDRKSKRETDEEERKRLIDFLDQASKKFGQ